MHGHKPAGRDNSKNRLSYRPYLSLRLLNSKANDTGPNNHYNNHRKQIINLIQKIYIEILIE